MTTTETTDATADAFAGRMLQILNDGLLVLMISIGHQTGLFDAMASLPPSTSPDIARAAQLNERYVREWLGAMFTGKIVRFDAATRTYTLPPEHAAFLTRAARTDNLAMYAQYSALLGAVEQDLLDRFRHGGGLPYSSYPRFQQIQAEESAQNHNRFLMSRTLPLVPGLIQRLREGIDAADIGCGHGKPSLLMAEAFPKSHFLGLDLSTESIAAANAEAVRLGLPNARFEVRDAAALTAERRFDFISAFDSIHDQARPAQVLTNVRRALRPGGVFLMVDIGASSELQENADHPMGPLLYTVSCLHCMSVSLAAGGPGLGAMWGEQKARQMLAEAGFGDVRVDRVEGDMMNLYYVARV
jgi:SAM-dependent methyltransferase